MQVTGRNALSAGIIRLWGEVLTECVAALMLLHFHEEYPISESHDRKWSSIGRITTCVLAYSDHEEPIYYRLMSKQSSRLSSQDSEEGTSLDVGTRDPNVGAEGESSLDRGTRPSSTASLLCTQGWGMH